MHKYTTLPLFFCGMAILLLWFYFPIAFDNNDDQIIYGICAGIFTGTPSSHIVLSHIFIGKFLQYLFSTFPGFNFYTLYLELVLLCCFIAMGKTVTTRINTSIFYYWFIPIFIFLGLFSLVVVSIQFTMVAILCAVTTLLLLQSNVTDKYKIIVGLLFIVLAILIRKESFYIFLLFVVPLYLLQDKTEKSTTRKVVFISIILFALLMIINNNDRIYKQQKTYRNIETLNILATQPIQYDSIKINKAGFSIEDISIIKWWFLADDSYWNSEKLNHLAKEIRTIRNMDEVVQELKIFIELERYSILIFLLSLALVLWANPQKRKLVLFNTFILLSIIVLLLTCAHLPFRVSNPIFIYLILTHIYYSINSEKKSILKTSALLLLFVFAVYKFNCVLKLSDVHHQNEQQFKAYMDDINNHPEYTFVFIDAFPFHLMNAWKKPETFFKYPNILISGWYAYTPDYATFLKQRKLKNLSTDLIGKEQVVFLCRYNDVLKTYLDVLQQRYAKKFKVVSLPTTAFKILAPKKLVLEN
ncbi:MAG: hypothetical protein KDD21_10600 [Bacteroidetes bacterium]|nr:hypothetical protein [Bacteroidota bacterium]